MGDARALLEEIQQRWGWLWQELRASHLTVAGILHVWEWYGMLEQIPSVDWIAKDVSVEDVVIAYRELRQFLSALPYSECVMLVDTEICIEKKEYNYSFQETARNCAALIDWHYEDVERWIGEKRPWGLAALVRRGEANDKLLLSRLECHLWQPRYSEQYEYGLLVWLHRVSYQQYDPMYLHEIFKYWRKHEQGPAGLPFSWGRGRGYTFDLSYLPHHIQHALDQALQEVVISDRLTGKAKMLIQQLGPALYGELLTVVVLHAGPTSKASLAASQWVVQQLRAFRENTNDVRDLLNLIPPGQRLNVTVGSHWGHNLSEHTVQEVLRSLRVENHEELQEIVHFLRQSFPTNQPIPTIRDPRLLEAVASFASGSPGNEVTLPPPQYYLRYTVDRPGDPIKQARVLLCAQGYYPKQMVLDAAFHAYDLEKTYRAHEAVAGALVHPEVSPTEKIELVEQLRANDLKHTLCRHPTNFRQQANRLFRWARKNDLVPSWCPQDLP